jgi:glycosyltransferase involved in cell wall biosynthesis
VVIVHWPDIALNRNRYLERIGGSLVTLGAMAVQRLRGSKVLWVTHNAGPHENRSTLLARIHMQLVSRLASGTISPSSTSREPVLARWPRVGLKPFLIVPISRFQAPLHDVRQVRSELRVGFGFAADDVIALIIGKIRPYKGVAEAVAEFVKGHNPRLQLLVAGQPADAEIAHRISAAAGSDPRVHLRLEHLGGREFDRLLAAADVVVLPYLEAENSAVAIQALSAGRPILATDLSLFRELRSLVGEEWVRLTNGMPVPEDYESAASSLGKLHGSPNLDWADEDVNAQRLVAWLGSRCGR